MKVMIIVALIVAFVGWLLCLGCYQATQKERPDRDTVVFSAKLWLGMGGAGILMFLLMKYG
jgi:hypothetical protein